MKNKCQCAMCRAYPWLVPSVQWAMGAALVVLVVRALLRFVN